MKENLLMCVTVAWGDLYRAGAVVWVSGDYGLDSFDQQERTTMNSKRVFRRVLVCLIVGMLPFSLALQRTGGVDLAADLSTDESPAFVNGLLGRIVDLKPTLLA